VDKDVKHAVIVVIAAVIIVAVAFVGVSTASGVSPFQTVIESGSMQHGIGSEIGIIDTGDVVILKSKDKVDIRTFVDGYKTGYKKFGNYGDVIIYGRDTGNPIIHRAILWLDYNGDGTWSAPSLKDYPSDLWSCASGDDYNKLSGWLSLTNMGYTNTIYAALDLNTLVSVKPASGYITMGDNNPGFDQPASVSGVNGLISYEQIRSVAWIEVPWVGAFKMILNDNKDALERWVPNTIPNLTAASLLVLFLIIGISFLFDYRFFWKYRKEMNEELYAPAPLFPVEDEDDE